MARAELISDDELFWPTFMGKYQRVDLPSELVIRELLELDLESTAAVVDFVSSYGVISRPWQREDTREPHAATRIPVADVRAHLAAAATLARHWLAFVDDDHLEPAWEPAVRWAGWLSTDDEHWAWVDWATLLNEGVSVLRVRAEVWGKERSMVHGAPTGGLYTALCVQLYNLVVEGHAPKVCEDEACNRRFVRQRGGAKAGQYRLHGVRYCSPKCARRQGQRRRRETLRLMRR